MCNNVFYVFFFFHQGLFGKHNKDHPVLRKFIEIIKRVVHFNYVLESIFDIVYSYIFFNPCELRVHFYLNNKIKCVSLLTMLVVRIIVDGYNKTWTTQDDMIFLDMWTASQAWIRFDYLTADTEVITKRLRTPLHSISNKNKIKIKIMNNFWRKLTYKL